ncbi:N-acetylgalactosamine-6-sulfatase-like [Bolinopsis microptera]|uniref:N-acetylgalactosamine-6-sulfatase-like n=1 Tax=Bolinopsis microptera TaxID=2820187 RepID=UPI00307A9FAA
MILLVVLSVLATLGNASANDVTKPNIVIMYMDDMGWGDIGANGNWAKETPNIDKMASEGMLFPSFYSAAPICSPSRAALMTGRLPIRNGFYSTNRHGVNAYTPQTIVGGITETEYLLPQLLKEGGYKSKIIGKWHMGHRPDYLPLNRGFDEFFGSPNCHFGPYDDVKTPNAPVYKDDLMLGRYYTNYTIHKGLSNLTQIFIKEGTDFIENQAKAGNPFLLYWTPDANHQPAYSSEMFWGKSRRDSSYGDSVMEVDYGVGVILAKLKELNIEQNTLVFFSSDNGAEGIAGKAGGSNGPLLCGKQTTFEGGMREPGIAWWPGTIKPGVISPQLGTTMDILVTAVGVAGLQLPSDRIYDGIDLFPVLSGKVESIERPVWYYRGNELFAVRVGQYKAHLWTWSHEHYNFCPGEYVKDVTTPDQVNRTSNPIVINLDNDPGEKYTITSGARFKEAMALINPYLQEHRDTMVRGEPSLNYCDKMVMNWAPRGCEEINYCLQGPTTSSIKLCGWDH